MIANVDTSTLSGPAQKILGAPEKMQVMAARGIVPGIRPDELVLLLVLFLSSPAAAVKEAAFTTLRKLPEPILNGAIGTELHPAAIDELARSYVDRVDVLERLFAMSQLDLETVEYVAAHCGEKAAEFVATNEQRLLGHPKIIELLYMNKNTRMSTADRLVELAVRNGIEVTGIGAWREAAAAIQNELIMEATDEPSPDDILFQETQALAEQLAQDAEADTHTETDEGEEVLDDKFLPLHTRIAQMTITQKIRTGMLGSKEERMLLVRDSNRMVAVAAVRSPLMAEPEALLISRNKNMSEDVLRVIGGVPEFTKSYQIKKNLCENPKTPIMISMRLLTHLRENDLRHLAKSKNVTGPIKDAARRHMDKRK